MQPPDDAPLMEVETKRGNRQVIPKLHEYRLEVRTNTRCEPVFVAFVNDSLSKKRPAKEIILLRFNWESY